MTRLLVKNASEICVPEETGRGVERFARHALVIRDGLVEWIGPESQAPASLLGGDVEVYDAAGCAVLPALVDCHTHLVWAGDRIEDFSARARGATYAEIAARGGGILTTVNATRAASVDELASLTRGRLVHRRRYGIGTTEVKSGYGLTVEHELRELEVVRVLEMEGWDLEPTLLAAHAVPRDVPREAYVDAIVTEMIPRASKDGLARFADVFVERGAYTLDEGRRVFAAAKQHGLIPRIHADQLTPGGGAELAAEVGAASADHLEHTSPEGLAAMARAGVVAVLLPGALAFLGDGPRKMGAALREHGVEVAVATDMNPGSSPLANLPLAATLATTLMGLTVEEALRAVTLGGARALRRTDVGTLRPGAKGRFIVLAEADSRALIYSYGEPIIRDVRL